MYANDSYNPGAITGNREAQMEWKHYWVKVVARYHVVIEGWPNSIPFKNLSTASSPLTSLNTLLQSWQDGMTYWKKLTSDEADKLIRDLKSKGEIQEPQPRRIRSDRGKKRKQRPVAEDSEDEFNPSLEEPKCRKRRKATTPATLDSDEMEDSASDGGI